LFGYVLVSESDSGNQDSGSAASKEISVIQGYGFKNIKLTGWKPFVCAKDDNTLFTDSFEAQNIEGIKVKGVICGGFFKGYTLRLTP
jgi:hypothetical protein